MSLDQPAPDTDPVPPPSRRTALRLAGAATIGAVAASALASGRAAAAGALTTDSTANTATTPTGLQVNGTTVSYGIGVTDHGLASIPTAVQQSAVLGHAIGDAFTNGVTGYATGSGFRGVLGYADGTLARGVSGIASGEMSKGVVGEATGTNARGVVGTGPTGVLGAGNTDNGIGVQGYTEGTGSIAVLAAHYGPTGNALEVDAAGAGTTGISVTAATYGAVIGGNLAALVVRAGSATAPSGRTGTFVVNAVDSDTNGNLWHCVAAGTPGTWRKLSGPSTGGAFHPIDPVRVYDSRSAAPTPGALGSGSSRVVSVADARDGTTGAVVTAGAVPAGATAIAYNLTVVDTIGSGFLSVAPGNAASSPSSSINWSATGQILANGLIGKVHTDRTVKVFCGGGGTTHFVIDVTGYWM
jgi:hypothetical protein